MSTAPLEGAQELGGGQYEVLRSRLAEASRDLHERLQSLNSRRKAIFGAVDYELVHSENITTSFNCTPRDMIAVGQRFIFGYNIHMGLKSKIELNDVFSVYGFDGKSFVEEDLSTLLGEEKFSQEFSNLQKYYREAQFSKFARRSPFLFMNFQTGKSRDDFKTFKWIEEDHELKYGDNRSDRDFNYPEQHSFQWKRTHRDLHVSGDHPHISIEDKIFVETVGGDLTIKIEDNTESGQGIYEEPVENLDQTLDDAEIHYAIVDNIILLKILPYQEKAARYIAYNDKVKQAWRIDAIEQACVFLPEAQGIVFPGGILLQSGILKTFDVKWKGMVLDQFLSASNGEDYIYSFYEPESGTYLLHPYNLVEQNMDAPIACQGKSLFEDGKLVMFKGQEHAQKHHNLQVWQTPFGSALQSEEGEALSPEDIFLKKLGNKELVTRLAECKELVLLAEKDDSYSGLFLDIVENSRRLLTDCFWLEKEETGRLDEPLQRINETATTAMDEFEKVRELRIQNQKRMDEVIAGAKELLRNLEHSRRESVSDFVKALQDLRAKRGEVITLKELKYVDIEAIDVTDESLQTLSGHISQQCVDFLQGDEALVEYEASIEELNDKISSIQKGIEAKPVQESIRETASGLELLTDVVSNLKIDDPTQSSAILENISGLFARLNQAKAGLQSKSDSLALQEGKAEFSAQMKLLDQSLASSLEIAEGVEECEEALSKTMVKLEELEGRFGEHDTFLEELTEKRNGVLEAFESKKNILQEQRQRKVQSLLNASERILSGIKSRLSRLKSAEEMRSAFASDMMVEKARGISDQLKKHGDTVKSDELETSLKSLLENAIRQLKDQQDLYSEGGDLIQLGKHQFSVNRQKLELSIAIHHGEPHFHLGGTDYYQSIEDEEFLGTKAVWSQEVVSENESVYRGEFLAHHFLLQLDNEEVFRQLSEEEKLEAIGRFALPRHREGYIKGLHDHDALAIVNALLEIRSRLEGLKGTRRSRALARLVLATRQEDITLYRDLANKRSLLIKSHPTQSIDSDTLDEVLTSWLDDFAQSSRHFEGVNINAAREVLVELLVDGHNDVCTKSDYEHFRAFERNLELKLSRPQGWTESPLLHIDSVLHWAKAYLSSAGLEDTDDLALGLTSLYLSSKDQAIRQVDASLEASLSDMKGRHPFIKDGVYELSYNRLLTRLEHFQSRVQPMFEKYESLKRNRLSEHTESLRLDEFKPRVLTSFVRNRLIDEVYLPIIGDNLAKQISAVGPGKRTDLMGLLLLISPPGYGKTTLMEYVSDRLGLTFVKINGPTIGHRVLSLDPEEAPNASSASELRKLNFALEMGNNIMLYLDDIQHLNPEFLQKFISLCDGQRRIEGVHGGRPKTYDLRGKKVAVVMAGNPYTESGDKFQIPDMLANRADTYNLGDILGGFEDAFKLSYIENSMTSNGSLGPLTQCSRQELNSFVKAAESGEPERIESSSNLKPSQIDDIYKILSHMVIIRDVVLNNNQAYIASAAQDERDRVEPAFKLQGSYRNMNKMVEKILPIMNSDEVIAMIEDHYRNESQTLTDGAEANFLQFKSLNGWLNQEEDLRWKSIVSNFAKDRSLMAVDDNDPLGPVLAQFALLNQQIESIGKNMGEDRQTVAEPINFTAPEVRVVNKVPRALANVVESQFSLMESWMKPLLKAQLTQSKDLSELKDSMGQAHQHYKELILKIIAENPEQRSALEKKFKVDTPKKKKS